MRYSVSAAGFAFAVLACGLTAACDPITGAVVGTGASVGVAAAEDRGVEGAVDDTKIRVQINDLWFREDNEMFSAVGLTVHEGRVMLTGTVKKPEMRVTAVRLAWQASGVREVIDEIEVTDQTGVSDYANDVWIANNLRTRLMFDDKVKNINYTVDAVNGTIYLMGVAQNQDELDRVVAHARDISGVKRVISHVVLRSDPARRSAN
ncbi:MAG TPA: BON domain-containing protein [Candidatus Sulfotelmatobacter sp.]|jgi:osmotically-inducible protein OsmY|nr:BON domain-containing protein [Candidatus Sulfotelmatobacter sp.]